MFLEYNRNLAYLNSFMVSVWSQLFFYLHFISFKLLKSYLLYTICPILRRNPISLATHTQRFETCKRDEPTRMRRRCCCAASVQSSPLYLISVRPVTFANNELRSKLHRPDGFDRLASRTVPSNFY